MPTTNATVDERTDTGQIDERTERALAQYLTVLPNQGRARNAPSMALVVSESGSEYLVDVCLGTCECDDYHYREPAEGCKHVRRARYALGAEPIRTRVASAVDVDSSLGEHCDADLQFATADGGIVSAGGQDDDVDDDCACGDLPDGVPCFECFDGGSGLDLEGL